MIEFETESKIRGAVAFIETLHLTARCSAEEIKLLLQPKIIDEVVRICAARAQQGGQL